MTNEPTVHLQAGGSPPGCGVLTLCGELVMWPEMRDTVIPQGAKPPATCPACLERVTPQVLPFGGQFRGDDGQPVGNHPPRNLG